MSATPPPTLASSTLEGTQAPSQIEFLWERYRPLFWVVVAAALCALGANYGVKYYNQQVVDKTWSAFSKATNLDQAYTASSASVVHEGLSERLRMAEPTALEGSLAAAEDSQKPFLLLAVARKAMIDANWDRAESALTELETKYPNHSIVKASDYPVQVREQIKQPKSDPSVKVEPELKPTQSGSAVALMREQIAASRTFASPAHFAHVSVPPDAKKFKFELSSGGTFVIAMMPSYAPKHVESFLKRVTEGYWSGLAVDEIQRPTESTGQPRTMHLGFETTKDDDRLKWTTTDPSKNLLDFEANDLSHFAGAVSGRLGADGKSSAERFWIVADDAPRYDGERVIFGYVVEGLDVVKRICDESMSAQEEQSGRGKPTANIRVVAVTEI